MNDTPRTDIIIQQTNGFGTASAIQRLVEFSRQLERAYNEVTEQRDDLLRYNEEFRKETLICADCDAISKEEYDQAIEQRDRLAEATELFLSQPLAPLAPLREALAAVEANNQ